MGLESQDKNIAKEGAKALKTTLLVYGSFDKIAAMVKLTLWLRGARVLGECRMVFK